MNYLKTAGVILVVLLVMYFMANSSIGNQRKLGKHEAHVIGSITAGIIYGDSTAVQLIDIHKSVFPISKTGGNNFDMPEYWEAVYKTRDGVYVYKRYLIHNDTVSAIQM